MVERRFMRCSIALVILCFVAFETRDFADVSVNGVFADHMALQRGMAVPVWGTASPGEAVSVTFAGQ